MATGLTDLLIYNSTVLPVSFNNGVVRGDVVDRRQCAVNVTKALLFYRDLVI